jgi:hypothetical protein
MVQSREKLASLICVSIILNRFLSNQKDILTLPTSSPVTLHQLQQIVPFLPVYKKAKLASPSLSISYPAPSGGASL